MWKQSEICIKIRRRSVTVRGFFRKQKNKFVKFHMFGKQIRKIWKMEFFRDENMEVKGKKLSEKNHPQLSYIHTRMYLDGRFACCARVSNIYALPRAPKSGRLLVTRKPPLSINYYFSPTVVYLVCNFSKVRKSGSGRLLLLLQTYSPWLSIWYIRFPPRAVKLHY